MSKVESNLLSTNQFAKILMFSMIGMGILSLPNDMVKGAKWEGWITAIISSIYPLYIVFMAAFLSKKQPNENILILSKKYLGNILGTIMNIIFLFIFIFYFTTEVVGASDLLRTYIVRFLNNYKFTIIFIALSALTAYRGLKLISQMSEIVFYCLIIIGLTTLLALYRGSYLNVMPIISGEMFNVIKGITDGFYSYVGIEIILLIYPRIQDKNKVMSSSVKAVLITSVVYTWITFTAIYYLGVSTIKKTIWSTLYVIESLRLPLINNFRLVAMFLWTILSITDASLFYYSSTLIVKDCIKSLSRKAVILTLLPITFFLCLYMRNEIRRRGYISMLIPIAVIFNVLYVSIIALLVKIKEGRNYEK